jgi:hypothetical protein
MRARRSKVVDVELGVRASNVGVGAPASASAGEEWKGGSRWGRAGAPGSGRGAASGEEQRWRRTGSSEERRGGEQRRRRALLRSRRVHCLCVGRASIKTCSSVG